MDVPRRNGCDVAGMPEEWTHRDAVMRAGLLGVRRGTLCGASYTAPHLQYAPSRHYFRYSSNLQRIAAHLFHGDRVAHFMGFAR